MALLCPACLVLQLPRIEQFKKKSVSKDIVFHLSCTIGDDNIIRPFIQDGESDEQEIRIGDTGQTAFCGKCDFCILIFEALSRRYSTEIARTIQEFGSERENNAKIDGPRLMLRLSTINFHSSGKSYIFSEMIGKQQYISLVTLEGILDIVFKVDETEITKDMALRLPFEVFTDNDEISENNSLEICRRPLDPQTLSSGNVKKIKSWLQDCLENHPKCALFENCEDSNSSFSANGKRLFLPTRLVHVGRTCSEQDPGQDPKVIVSSREFCNADVDQSQVRYLALSYCWGDMHDTRRLLTSSIETLDNRQKAISWTTIPKTFQDVILLARELGIRYVWIDSLCIIQGEGGDWEQESGKMWSVFSNAFLTVAAAAGSSSHSGFLDRYPSRCCQVFLPGSSTNYSLRHRPGQNWQKSDRMAEISSQAWIKRGWTYQEERLARRVLMFGENKFFYDCRVVERSEDSTIWGRRPQWSEIVYTQYSDQEFGLDLKKKSAALQDIKRRIFDHWQWLCVQYSHRKLSFPEDKLIAFSGVASAVASKVQSRYLAGLWEDNLIHDLFWIPRGVATKSPIYRAPSWSWVALETDAIIWKGPKPCLGDSCKLYCEVLEAETTLVGPNLFGAISGAHLIIRGNIIEVGLSWQLEGRMKEGYPWSMTYEDQKLGKAKLDLLGYDTDGTCTEESQYRLWALLLMTCGKEYATTQGLLLHKVSKGDEHVVYERQGTFFIHTGSLSDLEPKLAVWKRSESKVCRIE